MKITKFVHSCLLVEIPEPVNRTALFDPGSMCTVDIDALQYLDDIVITHSHSDHFNIELIKKLATKFPHVHISAPDDIVGQLDLESIPATSAAGEGIELFESPHEVIRPFIPSEPPQEIGVHYHDKLTHPGDSHSFNEAKAILALPVQAPWGSTVDAMALAIRLNPRYIIPIHDWHWSNEARATMYAQMERDFADVGITFIQAVNGESFVLDV